ncbi:hypothetical protein MRX96_001005 [Rhipicephalus microplus]
MVWVMFTAAHMKKFRHSASQWSSDLSSVPQVTSDVIDNHIGESHRQLLKGWMFKEKRLSQKCQHVAALLFAIRGIQTPSCTSTPCRWMAPTQGQIQLIPKPLAVITFKKQVTNKTVH